MVEREFSDVYIHAGNFTDIFQFIFIFHLNIFKLHQVVLKSCIFHKRCLNYLYS